MAENGYRLALETLRGRKSQIREVPIDQLVVDKRFQRPLNEHAVKMIKDNYHPKGIGYILVAHVVQEDGTLGQEWAVIDGQTRWKGIEELQHEGRQVPQTISAEAFDELTPEEAAVLFGLRNGQRPVPPAERDRMLMHAGDPALLAIVEAAADVGYVVFRDDPDNEPPATMPHLTEAKRVLTWGAKYNRSDLLGLSLAIQAKAFGTELGDCDKQILTATADLLLKNPHLVEDELVRVLSGRGIAGLLAEGAAEARRMDKRLHAGIQKAIADIYNKGKTPKDKERIDWKSGRVKAEPELQDA